MITKTDIYIIESYIDFIIPDLGLVIAIAWNSAFQNYFDNNEELKKHGPWAYAFIVTIIIMTTLSFLKTVKKTI